MGHSQSKAQHKSSSDRYDRFSGQHRSAPYPAGKPGAVKTRANALPPVEQRTRVNLPQRQDDTQLLLHRNKPADPRKPTHGRSHSTSDPLSSHPPKLASSTAHANPSQPQSSSRKKSKHKRLNLSLSILPSNGDELEQARARERQRERWRGIDQEGAKLLGVGPPTEEELQRKARRASKKQAEKDRAKEREWAEECGRQRHKAALWEQYRRLQSAEKAALLQEQQQEQQHREVEEHNAPRRSTSRHDTVSRRKSQKPKSYSNSRNETANTKGGSILTVMGVQPLLPDGSLTALPLFPPSPVNGTADEDSGQRLWNKCVKAGLVVDVDLQHDDVARNMEHPLRWKWIHKKGKSVNSVDEELGFV